MFLTLTLKSVKDDRSFIPIVQIPILMTSIHNWLKRLIGDCIELDMLSPEFRHSNTHTYSGHCYLIAIGTVRKHLCDLHYRVVFIVDREGGNCSDTLDSISAPADIVCTWDIERQLRCAGTELCG